MGNIAATRSIKTIHFGELSVESHHIYTFKNGLLGFEDLQEYVLISDDETQPFKWLISMDEPNIGFPLLNPWLVDIDYKPGRDINPDEQAVFCVVTLNDVDGMTINLKAPVVLSVEELTGEQIILTTDKYSPNHLIVKKNR